MRVRLLWLFSALLLSLSLQAQKMQKVKVEYVYYAPDNVSLEEAKRTALERAKIQAIADTYGTIVSQSYTTLVTNKNGQTNTGFLSLGGSEVKGEWIETIGEPEYDITYQQETLVVKVTVAGRVREIVGASVDFDARVLCNGTDLKFERQDFRKGDDLYLYFKSPIDGYLAVYLLDEVQEMAYCLLPYRKSNGQAFAVRIDKPYLLFSQEAVDYPIDEYVMTCNRSTEYNALYILFSPHLFAQALSDDVQQMNLPGQVAFEDFRKWLVNQRKIDRDMRLEIKSLTVKQ